MKQRFSDLCFILKIFFIMENFEHTEKKEKIRSQNLHFPVHSFNNY